MPLLPWVFAFAAMLLLLWFGRRELRSWSVDDTRFAAQIAQAAARHGVDDQLVRALIYRESRFRSRTEGAAGEVGLMQILPSGAVADWARENRKTVPERYQLFDPEFNLEIGCWFLAKGLRRWQAYREQIVLALCQYNAGESRANQWKPQTLDGTVMNRIGIASTKSYVTEIMERYRKYCTVRERRQP